MRKPRVTRHAVGMGVMAVGAACFAAGLLAGFAWLAALGWVLFVSVVAIYQSSRLALLAALVSLAWAGLRRRR